MLGRRAEHAALDEPVLVGHVRDLGGTRQEPVVGRAAIHQVVDARDAHVPCRAVLGRGPRGAERLRLEDETGAGIVHTIEETKSMIAELNSMRRELGREKEPFDIMMHCPDATTIDDIRRLEEMGVTDLQVTPWSVPGILAEMGVGAIMQQQPPLAVKLEAIERYAERVIARCA